MGRRFFRPALFAVLVAFTAASTLEAAEPGRKSDKPASAQAGDDRKLDQRLRERTSKTGESDVIVELNDGGDDLSLLRGYGRTGRKLTSFNGRVLRVPNRLLKQLANHPRVKRVVEDREVKGSNGRTAITIGSRAVVDLMGYTGAGVGVAVIDSGITSFHLDLTHGNGSVDPSSLLGGAPTGQRVTHFKDFVNNLPAAYDDWGHGTHVAGIVAGNGTVSSGRHEGIAPGANIIALKALNGQGVGTISNIIAAIDYAIANKAAYNIRVINLSLGAGVYESYNTDPLTLAAKRAVDAGIVVVAAAGNLGRAANGSPQYGAITAPGNAPWVLTVGASSTMGTLNREDDTVASYSSRGPTMHDFAAKPDVVAPGTGVVSLSDSSSLFYTTKAQALLPGLLPGLGYQPLLSLTGTSMAAPAVSGTVALMLHANPNLTPNMVKAILQFTAQEYPNYNYLTQGAGFLNSKAAVTLAEYFHTGAPGAPYPLMKGWSKHLIWGNYRLSGGVITPAANAYGTNIVWGQMATDDGRNIVWGQSCEGDEECRNIVWGQDCDPNDPNCNIVWGQSCDPNDPNCNIVWGQNCDASDPNCNIVWGQTCDPNDPNCNIVWGNECDPNDPNCNIVWGQDCDPNDPNCNIVWGQNCDPNDPNCNIVWGQDCGGANCQNIVWGQECDPNDPNCNIVWGEACDPNDPDCNIVWGEQCDPNDPDCNIVWGEECDPNDPDCNIVWGEECDPNDPECNIVWGNTEAGNIVWGQDSADSLTDTFGSSPIDTFDSARWDAWFELSVDILAGTMAPGSDLPPPPPPDEEIDDRPIEEELPPPPPPPSEDPLPPPPTEDPLPPPPTEDPLPPPPTEDPLPPPPPPPPDSGTVTTTVTTTTTTTTGLLGSLGGL